METKQAALIAAFEGLARACAKFKPLDKDGKPYSRVKEWIDSISALGELEVREMKGEDVGLDLAA